MMQEMRKGNKTAAEVMQEMMKKYTKSNETSSRMTSASFRSNGLITRNADDAGKGPTVTTVAACVTVSVTIGTTRDAAGRAGQTFRASAAIGYRVGLRNDADQEDSGQILRI